MNHNQLFSLRDALERIGHTKGEGRLHIFNDLHAGDIYVLDSKILSASFDFSTADHAAVRCLLPLTDAAWIWQRGVRPSRTPLQLPIEAALREFEEKQGALAKSKERAPMKDDTRALPKAESTSGSTAAQVPQPMTTRWRLIHVASGEWVELQQQTSILGRQGDCDISIPEDSLSRQHCRVSVVPRGLLLTDLESTNGTFVKGYRVTEGIIGDRDEFSLGEVKFRCQLADGLATENGQG